MRLILLTKNFFQKKGVLIFFKQKQVWELDCKYKILIFFFNYDNSDYRLQLCCTVSERYRQKRLIEFVIQN